MWRALFIGWLALALAEEATKKEDTPSATTTTLTKRQNPRGSTVVYGASPGQYSLQSGGGGGGDRQPQAQIPSDYQQQSELYVISPNRKPAASALTYSSESPRRPQYIQLSALQLQAAQQQQHHLVQQQQPIHHAQPQQHHHHHPQQQQQIAYESLIGQTEAGHGSFYRPAVRYQQAQPQPQPEARVQPEHQAVQYAASAIVDSHAGSFERELAQLVAANRAQEQKYNAGQVPKKLVAAPQQYLKEVTRPAPQRQLSAARVAPNPVQYQPIPVSQQSAPLYRLIYQADQLQQLPQVSAQPQYKQQQASHEPATQYARPQLQQYIHAQPHAQPQLQLQQVRLRPEDDGAQLLRAHAPTSAPVQHRPSNDASTSSRSTIYVSQSTPLKKPAYTALAALAASERDEDEPKHQVAQVRLPQRNRPLTQDEFQQLIQSGAYTAQLVPSDNPNSPHHEYLLHPTGGHGAQAQRPAYTSEKQEAQQTVTYLLPQSQAAQHQRQVKRRPVYNIQQA